MVKLNLHYIYTGYIGYSIESKLYMLDIFKALIIANWLYHYLYNLVNKCYINHLQIFNPYFGLHYIYQVYKKFTYIVNLVIVNLF